MKYVLSIIICTALAGFSAPAVASINSDGMSAYLGAAQVAGSSQELQVARRGADYGAGHDRGGAAHRGKGRGGHDDGANHA